MIQFQCFYGEAEGVGLSWDQWARTLPAVGAWLPGCRRFLICSLASSCSPTTAPLFTPVFWPRLFVGFSLTPTANLADSDKALKSSACVSHSGWAGPSWMRAVHRAEVGAHMAGGRGRKAPLPAVVGRERQAQVAQSQLHPRRSQTMKYIPPPTQPGLRAHPGLTLSTSMGGLGTVSTT